MVLPQRRVGWGMYRNRAGRWACAVLASGFLAACAPSESKPVPSTSSAPVNTTSLIVAPAVEEPISLGDRWMKPCELIKPWDREAYGFGDREDGAARQIENGSECSWTAIDPASKTSITLAIAAYPDYDILGETYKNAPAAPGAFKPFGHTVPKLPSVFVAEHSTSCSYVVGFSAHQGVKVTYTRQLPFEVDDIKEKCAVPYSAAAGLVSDIRNP